VALQPCRLWSAIEGKPVGVAQGLMPAHDPTRTSRILEPVSLLAFKS
jgi:hypothetical protein